MPGARRMIAIGICLDGSARACPLLGSQTYGKHVGDNVLELQHYESHQRYPNSDDFAGKIGCHRRKVDRHADHDVAANTATQQVVPLERNNSRSGSIGDKVGNGIRVDQSRI